MNTLLIALFLLQDDKVKDCSYVPLKVGTTWSYKVNDKTFVSKISKHEKMGDTMCAVIEASMDGNVVATEHVYITDDGVYRAAYNGEKVEPPLRYFKLPPKKGDTWNFECKVQAQTLKGSFAVDEEEIQIGEKKYKTFTSCATDFEAEGQKISTKYWFAENVGMVKQWVKMGDTEFTLELDKYEPAK